MQLRHHRTGEHWQAIYEKLHNFCKVNSYHEIAADQFQAAMRFLASMENAPDLFRQPENHPDSQTWLAIGRVLLHAQDMRRFVNRYLTAFENLGIDNRGALWSYVHDSEPHFERVRTAFLAAAEHGGEREAMPYIRRQVIATAQP